MIGVIETFVWLTMAVPRTARTIERRILDICQTP
jgi:hypothetical protein